MPVSQRVGGSAGVANFVKVVTDDPTAIGNPVYVKGGGTVGLAIATVRTFARVLGFASQAVGAGFPVRVVLRGIVTRADWTAVAGTVSLTPGVPYFLDTVAGKITTTAPTTGGAFVARIGRAVNATDFDVQTEQQTIGL